MSLYRHEHIVRRPTFGPIRCESGECEVDMPPPQAWRAKVQTSDQMKILAIRVAGKMRQ